MIPLLVECELDAAPLGRRPWYLDALLYWAIGERLGDAHPSGRADPAEVIAACDAGALPLARVDTSAGWWWAASAVWPQGREQMVHAHRRPPIELYRDLTAARSVNVASGPDKALRIPVYRQLDQRRLRWSCIGDEDAVRALVERIPALGSRRTQGHGLVRPGSWRVRPDRSGPALAAYAREVRLRHIPIALAPSALVPGARVARRALPLRPPYHGRGEAPDAPPCPAIACVQIAEVA